MKRQVLRSESTQEAKKIWQDVEVAAKRAPLWVTLKVESEPPRTTGEHQVVASKPEKP
jgi:hypothetical protein